MDEEERSENEEEELTENSTISQIKKKKTKKSKKKKKSPTSSVKNSHELFRQLSYYVKETNDHGRYAVAKDTIPLGRCVLREQPYQVMSSGKLCMKCGKSISNGNTEVSQFHYCSNSCQSSFENNYFSCITSQVSKIRELCEVHDCSTDLVLISLLILFTQHFQTVESSDCLFQLIGNYVLSTPLGCQNQVSHLAMQNSEWVAALRGVFDSLLFGTFSTLFERERDIQILDVILEIAAKVNSNSYGIYDDFANDKPFLGFGVFPVAAMTINHSCRPNLINIYFDGKMEYRSIREIQKDEELTVSYINCLQGFTKRREELVTTRLFQCRCTRCYNHEQVLLRPHVSPNLSTDLMADLMLDGLHCNTCGMDYHTATVFKSLIGPSGVVLLSLTVPQQCYCIQCHQQFSDPSLAVQALDMAYSTWTSLSAALSRSPSLSQNLSNIEKWLIEFDPLFLEPVNSFPLQQLIRIKQTHSLQFQLHSRHSLIITAHKVYLRMLESHPDAHGNPVKSLQRYDRIYDIVKTIAPKYSIERIEFEKIFHEKLKETLNSSVTNAATKKSFQGYRKLFQDLGQNLTDFR